MPSQGLVRLSVALFLMGLFTCTWDKLLYLDVRGFTLKSHQLFFFLSFVLILYTRRKYTNAATLSALKHGFPISVLALSTYYLCSSYWSAFPLKSALYSGWIVFNLFTIWFTAQLLAPYLQKKQLTWAAWFTMIFHACVLVVDHAAYQFGYTGGLVGFNQDEILKWGVSRPHAYASEPSYIAAFFALAIILNYSEVLAKRSWRVAPVVLSLFSFFALLATTSRTGLFGLVIGIFLLLSLELLRRRKLPWRGLGITAILFIISFAVLFVTTPSPQKKILDSSLVSSVIEGRDGSGNARLRAHIIAYELAHASNWLGVGLGASHKYWTNLNPQYIAPIDPKKPDHGQELVMSIWGQLLAEGGLPALVLYGLAGFFLISGIWQAWRLNQSPLTSGALVSSVVFFFFIAFFLGNVARGDIWVWFAIWSRMALPDSEEAQPQRV